MILSEFYTTSGCHLCEDALALLVAPIQQGLIQITSIDIADDDELVEVYGIRIPVLKRLDTNQELGWPFDEEMLAEFIAK